MQNEKIWSFVEFIAPLVSAIATALIRSAGWQVSQTGSGRDTILTIQDKDRQFQFFLENLLLEIVTVDRDAQPLVFDESILEPETFLKKTLRALASKLNILFCFMAEADVEAAVDKISRQAENYERIRILRMDIPPS
jgi:hypothetical protein